MAGIKPVTYERLGSIAVVTVNNPPVNALGQAVRAGLLTGIAHAKAEEGVEALLLLGEGRNFIAGADIKEFGKPLQEPNLPDVCNRIECLPFLVVAALQGAVLGGGLEVALSAHYRIANPSARVGFPEVHLGLIPGAGGTQRLPRITGVDAAIELITSGRHATASEAETLGILDRIENGEPRSIGLKYIRSLLASGAKPRPIGAMPPPQKTDWPRALSRVKRKARGQIAPLRAVDAIQASATLPFFDGLKEERLIFNDLMNSDQRQAMIHAFFAERAVGALPELKGVKPRAIGSIGVIGGGTMGAGIATSALMVDLPVVLLETSQAAAETAGDRIAQNLEGAVRRGKLTNADYERVLEDMLTVVTDYGALASCDILIEAVFEDMAVKKAVFSDLDRVCKQGAVLATNTSYLDISEIAESTQRKADVIGLHFFSPAHVMKLLEIVVPDDAASEVVATGFTLAKRMGKLAVRSGVCDGFIGNRILNTYRTAADHMVLDGASPAQIDQALMAFGFAMGPYAVADMAGLDIGWANRKRLAGKRDPKERVARFPDRLCEAGFFGQKTGMGYYDYKSGRQASELNPKVMNFIEMERKDCGIAPRSFTDDKILSRYMAAMVNEAAKVVEEGIARRPLDVDLVLIAGYGFPRHRGGPCKWADLCGLSSILTEIESFAEEDSFFWQPSSLLQKLVEQGRNFDDLNRADRILRS